MEEGMSENDNKQSTDSIVNVISNMDQYSVSSDNSVEETVSSSSPTESNVTEESSSPSSTSCDNCPEVPTNETPAPVVENDGPIVFEDSNASTLPSIPSSTEDESAAFRLFHETSQDYREFNLGYTHEPEEEEEEHPVMKKTKPTHNWFMVPEILNRQLGCSAKKKGPELFQRRCYGSLHCAQRLELMYKLNKHDGCVNSLNFNPSGTLLASGSDDLNVVVWDWKVGKALLRYDTKHRSNVLQSKFLHLPGDLLIATCGRDGQVRLSQVSVQEGLRSNRKLGSHRGACHKLAVLHGQPHVILSAGEDGTVFHYDVRDFKPEKILNVRTGDNTVALYCINGHPLNPYEFCVGGRDSLVRSYDQRKCNGERSVVLNMYYPKGQLPPDDGAAPDFDVSPFHVTSAIYSHNGSEILASYNDDDIYLFDVNGTPGSFVHQYTGHRNGATIKGVNFFGPKSEFIVSGSDCGNVYIWEKNTESIVNWMMADDNGVTNCLEPHPQLPFLCTSGLDWDIKVWVPSCENDPLMTGLGKTVQSNKKSRNAQFKNGIDENRILWMLFRHFRNQNRFGFFEEQNPQSSGSSDSESDGYEGVSDCSPS